MSNVGTSLILLLLALVLLWLAVTDRLSRVLDAWDVITGKTPGTGVQTQVSLPGTMPGQTTTISLPSLPAIGQNAQVQV